MVEDERTLGVVAEERVVERPVVRRIDLGHADDDVHAARARGLSHAVGRVAGYLDGLTGEERERGLRLRIRPAGERLRPHRRRIGGDERLGEDDELRALRGGLGGSLGEPLDRGGTVEDDRLDLDACDLH